MTEQPALPFGRPHGRKTDPYTSDQALKAIARNGSLMSEIWWAANDASKKGWCFNDTWLTQRLEQYTGRRYQRNIIARARGLMLEAGLFRVVGPVLYEGRELMHYNINPNQPRSNQRG